MADIGAALTVISIVSTLCAIIFGYAAFARNRKKDETDDGKAITNGNVATACVDVLAESVSEWTDCEMIDAEEPRDLEQEVEELRQIIDTMLGGDTETMKSQEVLQYDSYIETS